MEPNEIQAALASAVEEVLETMCFTTVLDSSAGEGPSGGGATAVTAKLHFHGSPPGGFQVSLPMQLARAIAAGFLGLEEAEVSDSQGADVLCELTNMICGSVLSRLESETTFQICHPELAQPGPAVDGSDGPAARRWFDLGGGGLTASLHLQETV